MHRFLSFLGSLFITEDDPCLSLFRPLGSSEIDPNRKWGRCIVLSGERVVKRLDDETPNKDGRGRGNGKN